MAGRRQRGDKTRCCGWWPKRSKVGETHLLAATYHALPNHTRFYLTFANLAYTITRLGIQPTLQALSSAHLLCIDEFESDDVAQTRMASMFLRQLLGHK
jgi:cell division protein ZapE